MKSLLAAVIGTLCLLTSLQTHAQDETVADKLRLDFSGAWGGWNSQLTAFGDQNAVMNGGFGGLEFNKVIFLGWSAYSINDAVSVDETNKQLSLKYNGPVLAYTPLARSIVHPRFGLQFGFGKLDLTDEQTDRIALIQPSVGGELNVLRWFRLGAEFGYRFALNTTSQQVNDQFVSGPYGAATLKFGFSWGSDNGRLLRGDED